MSHARHVHFNAPKEHTSSIDFINLVDSIYQRVKQSAFKYYHAAIIHMEHPSSNGNVVAATAVQIGIGIILNVSYDLQITA